MQGRSPRRAALICALGLGCALTAAGCGGDGARSSATAPPEASDAAPDGAPAIPACELAGIDERGGRQGTCFIGDVTRTVVDRDRRLVFEDEIAIRLRDIEVSRRGGRRTVVASLRVENLGVRRLVWPAAAAQVALYAGERLYAQDLRGRSLALAAVRPPAGPRVSLAPGRAATVSAGWRLLPGVAARLRERGSAIIVIPPNDGGRRIAEAHRIGVLRLWK